MELLADRDPEEARKILDPVLERMMEAVHYYEGTVNQVMGDGIMALFGAPLAHEDHAVRACYAALRMQDAVRRYSDDLRRGQGVDVQIRVGLNSGDVVVRSIGNDLHMDYTAVGQTTHLAARMEQWARPGTSVITGDTLRLAEAYVQVKPIGPVPIKGLAEPMEVYELTGTGLARTRFQAAATRGLTRFVGRAAELEQLRRARQLAGEGHGQVVAVVGEAGVGKSRLFYEFTRSPRTQGWLILESSSVAYGKATSYLPVIDLLKKYFKIHDRDDPRDIRDKVIGRVSALDRSLEPLLPALLALLDVPVEDQEWQGLEPPERRQRTLEAVKRLLLRESHVQPLVLVFEDLHWVDPETEALLGILVESLPPTRLLLLVNYRPEYQHGWSNKTFYSQVRLNTLPPETTGELLDGLLGPDPGLDPLKQLMLKRGNPFFLEESVRTLVETKALVGERGAYRLTQPVQTLQVPATVHAILAARIDRLPIAEKQLLQAAAVVGKKVPYVVLHAIADLPEKAICRCLTHLQAAEFLYETAPFPEAEYTFKHSLTHEVAYATLLQDGRRRLHGRIIDTIESLYAGRLAEHVERLGHHAFRGEVWDKAVRYLRQAGAKAFERSANREAVACLEQALEALRHLPEAPEALSQAVDLRLDLRNPLVALGEFGKIHDRLREAEAFAVTLGNRRSLGLVANCLSGLFAYTGEYARGIEFGQRALAVGESLGDLGIRAVANLYTGAARFCLGNYPGAIESFTRATESLAGDVSRERLGQAMPPGVHARAWMAFALGFLGRFADAIACGEEAIRIAEGGAQPHSRVFAMAYAGDTYLLKGDLDTAIRLLEPSLALCRATDVHLAVPMAAAGLGYARALTGRRSEGLVLLGEAVEVDVSIKQMTGRALWVGFLSEACLLAGLLDDAIKHAAHALDLSRGHGARGWEAWSLRLLGEIHSHPDARDAGRAQDSYGEAMALATELGMRPLVAHCRLGLGKLYGGTGKPEQAHEHLTTATTMYREMDMTFWLEKAKAAVSRL